MRSDTWSLGEIGSGICVCGNEPLRFERAHTVRARLIGLLGKRSMTANDAIWLDPCCAIHTLGMQFDLAIYFLDRSCNVIEWHARVAPGQVCICLRASSVVETIAVPFGHPHQDHLERMQRALRQWSETGDCAQKQIERQYVAHRSISDRELERSRSREIRS